MASTATNDGAAVFQPRSYQLEMLEESKQRNIIVAMDTGSGKTHIAILRIAAELERHSMNKRVWFMCPSVALAQQQYRVISSQLPLFQSRLLSGNDGCDRWSNQDMWDRVLMNMNIIVCTYQILYDALIHGFVSMESILLLVFDEAHHCAGKHAANKIMQNFYHPRKALGHRLPHILGLTASPVMRRRADDLEIIESNLDAISRTPKTNREELLRHVHLPSVRAVIYSEGACTQQPLLLQKLVHSFDKLDYSKDPYVVYAKSCSANEISAKSRKAIIQRKTYCQEQMKTFTNMACTVYKDLGQWASQYYIHKCITRFQVRHEKTMIGSGTLEEREASYLMQIFSEIDHPAVSNERLSEPNMLTPKVLLLIDLLVNDIGSDLNGIIFVQTRASVYLLSKILSLHPKTKGILKVGTFVGASNHYARSVNIADLSSIDNQTESLDDLRSGRKNLIISTSVCEEGIDISACNAVICFEAPQNLKSFIQRRGRARSIESKYIIMFPRGGGQVSIEKLEDLEEEMKKKYLDDMRNLKTIDQLEKSEDGYRVFEIATSGAKLTLSDAVQHLYHFCNSLPRIQYVTLEPIFMFQNEKAEQISCRVVLPSCIDTFLREFCSSVAWRTERLARMDAAFEACIGLHHAGLLNDHLMPKLIADEDAEKVYATMERRPNVVRVDEQIDPWRAIATAWQSKPQLYLSNVIVVFENNEQLRMLAITPVSLNHVQDFILFWDAETRIRVEIKPDSIISHNEDEVQIMNNITALLLYSVFRGRMDKAQPGFPVLFVPQESISQTWMQQMQETYHATTLISEAQTPESIGLVRNNTQGGKPYVYYGIENALSSSIEDPDQQQPVQLLKVWQLPKRTDFLHPVSGEVRAPTSSLLLDPVHCEVDCLPRKYSQFALFVPCIMHRMKTSLIVNELCETLLAPVRFYDRNLVLTAISTPAAREATHYQRFEFLGDSILKFYTTLTLMAEKLNSPEGFLSSYKDHIVSNKTLAVAAKEVGLDRYILTDSFTGAKWRPLCNADLAADQSVKERELSTKTLADVVEAIIGAAYLDGGEPKVLACLKIFSLQAKWVPFQSCISTLLKALPTSQKLSESFHHLESLISHTFTYGSLLVGSITHPSYISKNTPSYQRLEFLGDVVLDLIVTQYIFSHSSDLQPFRMHLFRAAAVNAQFLGFLALSRTISIPIVDVAPIDLNHEPDTIPSSRHLSLPQFLLHAPHQALTSNLHATFTRFQILRESISSSLKFGSSYPWTELLDLSPEKLVSDLVESTLGAIYLDTNGDLAACERWLETLGVLPWLRRALDDRVEVWHPKEELGVCAVSDKVYYETWVEEGEDIAVDDLENMQDKVDQDSPMANDLGSDKWRCRVRVGDRDLSVASGRSRTIAEVRAADMAVKILRSEGNLKLKDEVDNKAQRENSGMINKSASLEVGIDEDMET